jgi:hypothetical protein
LAAPAAQRAANFFLAVAIHCGSINDIDPHIKHCAKDGIEGMVGDLLEAYFGCTEPNYADVHPVIAKAPCLHGGNPSLHGSSSDLRLGD